MRASILTTFLALLLATSVSDAQMRGGFGGRGGGGMRGGFAVHGPVVNRGIRGPAFRGTFPGRVPFAGRRGFIGVRGGFGFGFGHFRFCNGFGPCFGSPFFGSRFHHRDRFRFGFGGVPFFGGWGYAWPYYGYAAPVDYGNSDYAAQNQQYAVQQQQLLDDLEQERRRADELSDQLAATREPAPRTPAPAPARSAASERPSPPTTLVFRDNRKVDIQNYVIAGQYLYETDKGVTHKIALADLNIPATVKVNEERGVEFDVPK